MICSKTKVVLSNPNWMKAPSPITDVTLNVSLFVSGSRWTVSPGLRGIDFIEGGRDQRGKGGQRRFQRGGAAPLTSPLSVSGGGDARKEAERKGMARNFFATPREISATPCRCLFHPLEESLKPPLREVGRNGGMESGHKKNATYCMQGHRCTVRIFIDCNCDSKVIIRDTGNRPANMRTSA